MERNSIIWLGIYILLGVLELVGEGTNTRWLILSTKPLLMPLLLIWMTRRTPGIQRFFRSTMVAGLLFAMVGDIMMMFTGGVYDTFFFLLGLGAFLGTQVCYTGGFIAEINLRNGHLLRRPLWFLPFLLFLYFFLSWLWPDIPDGMQHQVAAYAVIISTMVLSVINLYGHTRRDVFAALLSGALLFLLSDSLIAISKFGHPFPGARIAIMLTYLIAQALIMHGVAERLRRFPEKRKRVIEMLRGEGK
ncbi:MAG: lysoplasmalogenase [Bacteroidetes bacterium]|nr:MAG: lysoplasmalogenase [Bacteroidota bacterium]